MKGDVFFIVIYLKHVIVTLEGTESHLGLLHFIETKPTSMTTLSVQTEDGDYLALTGESEKKEINMKEAGTDYSDDYDYDNEEEEEA